ncbi:MAG: hypothetical protein ACK5MP_06840 [Nostocoides sp.]
MTIRFDEGTGLDISADLAARIASDHRIFLQELRGFDVTEEVVVDRRSGQMNTLKYQFEYDRSEGEDAGAGEERLRGTLDCLELLSQEAFGLRLCTVDHVVHERRSEPIDQPGQRSTGEWLPWTSRQAFLSLYFDQAQWAHEWFRRDDVRQCLLPAGWSRVIGVQVHEECGLDRS